MYAINTKLMHFWFIIESYFPHRLVRRAVTVRANKDVELGRRNTWAIRTRNKTQKKVIRKISKAYRKSH